MNINFSILFFIEPNRSVFSLLKKQNITTNILTKFLYENLKIGTTDVLYSYVRIAFLQLIQEIHLR